MYDINILVERQAYWYSTCIIIHKVYLQKIHFDNDRPIEFNEAVLNDKKILAG